MAQGKGRNKRSSGSSYASTASTVVFVSLCIIGVWMLTPNSLLSSESTTTRTAVSQSNTNSESKQTAFQDNPGDLPDDAIKSDQDDANQKPDEPESNRNGNDEIKQDLETEKSVAENIDQNVKESVENVKQQMDSAAAVEQKPVGLQGKVSEQEQQKLNEHEIQLSEESVMTDNQEAEEIATTTTKEDDNSKPIQKTFEIMEGQGETKDDRPTKSKNNEAHRDDRSNVKEENHKESASKSHEKSKKDTVNEVTDEENEQRMKRQQQQKEDQVKENQNDKKEEHSQNDESDGHEEATSNDQIQHDEAPIDEHKNNNDTGDEKIQAEKHDQSLQTNDTEKESKPNNKGKKRRKKNYKSSNTEDNSFPNGESSGIPKESKDSKKAWSTQADQSENQKDRRKDSTPEDQDGSVYGYSWQLCNVTAGQDYIPCLDNEKAISKLRSRGHYEHRERHCPEEPPACLVPRPQGYKRPVEWPHSRDKIWYHNVPHTLLAEVKGHQNWVKLTGEFLTFPGGGTQFIHGALHYIDFIQEAVPEIAWGKHTRTVLDVGCGVASFGGFLFERDVLTMSFAPKDEHEAQVQFALERGIPAISAVMGTQRLPFPSRVFDLIHCARCRVPWHIEGGALLLELNRMLRPGGYFVWSATPVYQTLEEDVQIWKEMSNLTVAMCWELVTIKKDKLNSVGAAIYHKPDTNECYDERNKKQPPMCKSDDDPNAAWYVPLQSCMHRVPVDEGVRGSQWPQEWPTRLQEAPYWLNRSQMGVYGKPAPDDFVADYEHWQRVLSKSYLSGLGISWSNTRNIMDMRAVYGGFAAALKDLNVWVLNVVNIDSPDTLPIIYERGLFGIYHDWCESFSSYPRSYDLLHADHLFSRLKKRCKIVPVMAEVDRIVRPGGKLIVRDESNAVSEVENLLKSMHWEVHLTYSKNKEGILSAQKSDWRPESNAATA